jgi:hypothetical protein
VIGHGFLFALALLVAFGLAYNFHQVLPDTRWSPEEVQLITKGGWLPYLYLPLVALAIPIKLAVFALFGQYRRPWRCIGLRDVPVLVGAAFVGSFLFMLSYFGLIMFGPGVAARLTETSGVGFRAGAVFLSDLMLTFCLVAGTRVTLRLYHEETRQGVSEPDDAA